MSKKVEECYKYNIKVKSKIHNNVYHNIQVDLYCYEKMPRQNGTQKQNHKKT